MQPTSWWIFLLFFTLYIPQTVRAEMPNRFEINDPVMQGYEKLVTTQNWRNDCKAYALRQVSAQRPDWAKFVNRLCPHMYTMDDGQVGFNTKISPTRALSKMGTEVLLMGVETLANRLLDKEVARLLNRDNVTWLKNQATVSPRRGVKASFRLHANRYSLGIKVTINF